jgi:hypothetical protein
MLERKPQTRIFAVAFGVYPRQTVISMAEKSLHFTVPIRIPIG